MKKGIITLNVAILPDTPTKRGVIKSSKIISQNISTHFLLNSNDTLPHITVYQAAYPVKNIERLKKSVFDIAKNTSPFKVSTDGISISHQTFVFLNFIKSDTLLDLHNRVVGKINHLREGNIIENLPIETEEDKYDAKNYGALLIGPRYSPHITLSRIKYPSDQKKVLQLLDIAKNREFEVNKLVIGELGQHGTVKNIISTYALSP